MDRVARGCKTDRVKRGGSVFSNVLTMIEVLGDADGKPFHSTALNGKGCV